MYNATMWRNCVTIVAIETQQRSQGHFLAVFNASMTI